MKADRNGEMVPGCQLDRIISLQFLPGGRHNCHQSSLHYALLKLQKLVYCLCDNRETLSSHPLGYINMKRSFTFHFSVLQTK